MPGADSGESEFDKQTCLFCEKWMHAHCTRAPRRMLTGHFIRHNFQPLLNTSGQSANYKVAAQRVQARGRGEDSCRSSRQASEWGTKKDLMDFEGDTNF